LNILLTSIGRRNYLIDFFNNILKTKKIICINSQEIFFSKSNLINFYKSPKTNSRKYIKFILSIVKKNKIKLIIPLRDDDALKLSNYNKCFKKLNITLISPTYSKTLLIRDKYKIKFLLKKNNINYPNTYISKKTFFNDIKKKKIKYPVILKPRYGSGSNLNYIASNKKELNFFYQYISKKLKDYFIKKKSNYNVVIQDFIKGEEYNVDLINSLDGSYHTHIIKKKIRMRSGETEAGYLSNLDVSHICLKLSEIIKHNFLLDIDLIFYNKKFYIIDINPRIGGGYPFSHILGYNMLKFLLSQFYPKKIIYKKKLFNKKRFFLKTFKFLKH